jgi:hypothetical protein
MPVTGHVLIAQDTMQKTKYQMLLLLQDVNKKLSALPATKIVDRHKVTGYTSHAKRSTTNNDLSASFQRHTVNRDTRMILWIVFCCLPLSQARLGDHIGIEALSATVKISDILVKMS